MVRKYQPVNYYLPEINKKAKAKIRECVKLTFDENLIVNRNNIAHGLVIVWAYSQIPFKRVSSGGFSGQYPSVIVTAIACLILLVFFCWKNIL